MPGSVLGIGDTAEHQTDRDLYPQGAYCLPIEIGRACFNICHYSTSTLFNN